MNDDNRGPDDPMARWFAQFGGEGGSFDVQQMFEQLRSALGSMGAHQMGGIDWAQTTRAARQAVAAAGADPEPTPTQERAIADAHRLAAAWLDEFVSFDQVDTPPAAWSRAHWIDRTTSSWKSVAEPIVNRIAEALAASFASQFESGEGVPAEFEQFGEMLTPILRNSAAQMYSLQVAQAMGTIASELLSGAELGLQLLPRAQVVLLPTNVEAFGAGLDVADQDLILYLTLREEARQRLFQQVPWLAGHLMALLAQYASHITIDISALTDQVDVDQLRSMNPSELSALTTDLQGRLFTPEQTPEQVEILARLETTLALIEGWIDAVTSATATKWMPHVATRLDEAIRRRRATSNPAKALLSTLLGTELRPRRIREATRLWTTIGAQRGVEARDGLWAHPDLMPGAAELDDPSLALADTDQTSGMDEMDLELARLLDEASGDDAQS